MLEEVVENVSRNRLRFTPYKLQLVEKLYPQDKEECSAFCNNLQMFIKNYPELLSKIIYSDEGTFLLSGKVNRHNVRVWM